MTLRPQAIPSAIVAVVCIALAVHAELERPGSDPPAVVAIERIDALDLAVGQSIAGWRVVALAGTIDHELRIELARDDVRFAVVVTPMGARPENPPVQTATHAIYYGHAQPSTARIPDGAVRAITADIARRLDDVH